MSIEAPVFEAEVFLHCKNSLGEGKSSSTAPAPAIGAILISCPLQV